MEKKIKIKNILIGLALMAVFLIGGAAAFFTDTETAVNNFTVGDVEVSIDEPSWNSDEGADITPNKVILKDPTLTNEGANPAYVFLKVSVPKAEIVTSSADGAKEQKLVKELFTYNINAGWTEINKEESNDSNIYIYAYGTDSAMMPLQKGEKTPALFDSVKFINVVEGQIDGETLSLPVDSYAIQTADLEKTAPYDIYRLIAVQGEEE